MLQYISAAEVPRRRCTQGNRQLKEGRAYEKTGKRDRSPVIGFSVWNADGYILKSGNLTEIKDKIKRLIG